MVGKGSFTAGACADHIILPFIVMYNNSQTIAIYNIIIAACGYGITWLHMFELLYSVQHCEGQLIVYSLDLHISCSTHLVIFMDHEGSGEALNFPIITL